MIFAVATAVIAFLGGFFSIILAGVIGASGGVLIAHTIETTLLAQYFIGCGIGGLLGLFLGVIAKGMTSSGGGVLDDIGGGVDFDD